MLQNYIKLKHVRLSYAHLSVPAKYVQGQGFVEDEETGSYTAILIITKGSENEKLLLNAIKEAKSEALAAGIKALGKTVKITEKDMVRYVDGIKDGDQSDDDTFAKSIYINAKAKAQYKPKCYNKENIPMDNTELYSGCYVNAYIRLYNYAVSTNLGCGYGLIALQFDAPGERLGGTVDTDSIFGDKKVISEQKDASAMFD